MSEVIDIPKGYKHSVIGLIPEDWSIAKIGDVACIDKESLNGNTDPDFVFEYISLSDVEDKTYSTTTIKFKDAPSRARRKVQSNDIIMSTVRPNLQGFAIIEENDRPLIASTGFAVITADQIDDLYLFQSLFGRVISKQFYQLTVGSNYPAINSSDVRNLKIPYPSLPEQQKIASILSTWDKSISTTQSIIDELKLRNKGLAQQLLTGKKRLKGFEGEWEELRADKIFKNHTNKSHGGDLEILSATQERGVIPRSMNNIDIKFDKSSLGTYKKVEAGDYVISLRSFQGGIEYSNYEGLVSPAYTILKETLPISKTYYRIYFKTETFINRLNTIIYGIRDGKQISYKDFSTLKLPYPPLEEQNAISKILEQGDQEIKLYKKKLATLKEQKKGLMQKLLTGEIRVKL